MAYVLDWRIRRRAFYACMTLTTYLHLGTWRKSSFSCLISRVCTLVLHLPCAIRWLVYRPRTNTLVTPLPERIQGVRVGEARANACLAVMIVVSFSWLSGSVSSCLAPLWPSGSICRPGTWKAYSSTGLPRTSRRWFEALTGFLLASWLFIAGLVDWSCGRLSLCG